jgi:hypothetical protein
MRWQSTKPDKGDTRIRKGFLLRPRSMLNANGKLETRWFETATWEQFYDCGWAGDHYREKWEDVTWIDGEVENES